jgi:hypothetical protein
MSIADLTSPTKLAEQAWRIRRRLRGLDGAVPVAWLAADLGIPVPSVRRSLTELTKHGTTVITRNGVAIVVKDSRTRGPRSWVAALAPSW